MMFQKNDNYSLEGSCSALSNNLCVYKENEKVYLSCVHKSSVNLMIINSDGSSLCHLISLKKSSFNLPFILQAKWIKIKEVTVLVIASERGIQVFDQTGKILIYSYALPMDIDETTEAVFTRGIASCCDTFFCVGTSKGEILIFQSDDEGNSIDLVETIQGHNTSISDLCGRGNKLVSADDEGNLYLWEYNNSLKKLKTFEKFNCPCTSLALWKDLIFASYASGQLRIFSQSTGSLLAEVAAHARWITAVDIAEDSGLALSVSEDSFVRIWQLQNDLNPIISHRFSCRITDTQLCGGCFTDGSGKEFYTTGYELNEVIKFSM
ncbi:WD repeat-containing protein 54-like [Centruroides vittatus]|uniref:WD repeat-containing protein 54-like n=1 Tax=Centruroides vittatus TaxID=120091 RepID=UPI00350EBABC